MTHKERIMNVLKGEKIDKIPWFPRIDLWYNAHKNNGTLPEEYQNCSIQDILRKLGVGIWIMDGKIVSNRMRNIEIKIHYKDESLRNEVFPRFTDFVLGRHGEIENLDTLLSFVHDLKLGKEEILVEYITPVGNVSTKFIYTQIFHEKGIAPYQVEHMVKRVKDYKIAEYIIKNTELIPTYEDFLKTKEEIGEEGIVTSEFRYCPMDQLMQIYLGYEKFGYELYDHPKEMEHFLGVLTEQGKEFQKLAVESPAEIIRCGGNWDSSIISPSLFKKYFVPFFREFSEALHSKGKFLQSHTDGDMKNLLRVFLDSGIDIAECFTPYPATKVTLADARKIWRDKVTIWGGIPLSMLCRNVSDKQFENYMVNLFKEISPGDHFILGMGDNTPIDAKFERLNKITEMVDTYGRVF